MLLIPTFLKAAVEERGDSKDNVSEQVEIEQEQPETKKTGSKLPEGVQPTPPGMLSHVLKMILHDVSQLEFW